MTNEEIIKYKVIRESAVCKERFNIAIKNGEIRIIDSFKNEHGELYVIFENVFLKNIKEFTDSMVGKADRYGITGDELGWELGWGITSQGIVQRFWLTLEENAEMRKILLEKL